MRQKCTGKCGLPLPRTLKFYYLDARGRLKKQCKECCKAKNLARYHATKGKPIRRKVSHLEKAVHFPERDAAYQTATIRIQRELGI